MKEPLASIRPPVALLTMLAMLLMFLTCETHAQRRTRAAESNSRMTRDPEIARMLAEIDARNIERIIRKLVSFGTRNTLSAQDNPTRGIGAARDWLYSEFQKVAATSGGRMTVEKQTFEQAPGKFARIAHTTTLTNIVATLRGTQPASVNRMYVVSGHYDSICTNPTDAECD